MDSIQKDTAYTDLLAGIRQVFQEARNEAYRALNATILNGYWQIGKYIVEYEQNGQVKAEYGKKLLIELAKDLNKSVGKGFSRTNLVYMRLFYLKYPKSQTVSDQLSWSHYIELLSLSDDLERSFYEQQCLLEKWSVRELKRQKETALFQRIALSKDKAEILAIAKQGQQIKSEKDILKDPYIFEFLGLSEQKLTKEKELENKLIEHLQTFLLELGKGFAFVARQYRITLDNQHFYVDLVFYHHILKCFVLIDLKTKKVKHQDIGQMNMYINYFKTEETSEGDNEPIGIILSADKDDVLVQYALGGITNKLFVSKYQLYLPDKKLLQEKLRELLG
jgi:predicted nuclease of restriction endonuclease-like (RecB) superfamily